MSVFKLHLRLGLSLKLDHKFISISFYRELASQQMKDSFQLAIVPNRNVYVYLCWGDGRWPLPCLFCQPRLIAIRAWISNCICNYSSLCLLSTIAYLNRCWSRLFHTPTRTTSSGYLMLLRTVHGLCNLYRIPTEIDQKNKNTLTHNVLRWGTS